MTGQTPACAGGRNIALKIPRDQYEAVVAFYRDGLGLAVSEIDEGIARVEFGPIRLWLDRVPHLSQAEIWLEITAEDTGALARLVEDKAITRCDDIERLPAGFDGFWIKNPAGIVHLVAKPGQDEPQDG